MRSSVQVPFVDERYELGKTVLLPEYTIEAPPYAQYTRAYGRVFTSMTMPPRR